MMFKRMIVSCLLVAYIFPTVQAVKYGELDGENHPYVGLMVALDGTGEPLWRCSGTLISPTVYLTAGHCVEPPALSATLFFDADVESGIPDNGYPYEGDVSGKTVLYPEYDPNRFFVNDLGVVLLDGPVDMEQYGQLPTPGLLNEIVDAVKKPKTKFTAVGYGLQYINPVFVEAERIRYYSEPKLIQIDVPGYTGPFSILLSNNHSTGGTCFGDSGGPNFLNIDGYASNIVAGVTSFGKNGNCAGTGGVFRLDHEPELEWLNLILTCTGTEKKKDCDSEPGCKWKQGSCIIAA